MVDTMAQQDYAYLQVVNDLINRMWALVDTSVTDPTAETVTISVKDFDQIMSMVCAYRTSLVPDPEVEKAYRIIKEASVLAESDVDRSISIPEAYIMKPLLLREFKEGRLFSNVVGDAASRRAVRDIEEALLAKLEAIILEDHKVKETDSEFLDRVVDDIGTFGAETPVD